MLAIGGIDEVSASKNIGDIHLCIDDDSQLIAAAAICPLHDEIAT
jgi:hypothetical protein